VPNFGRFVLFWVLGVPNRNPGYSMRLRHASDMGDRTTPPPPKKKCRGAGNTPRLYPTCQHRRHHPYQSCPSYRHRRRPNLHAVHASAGMSVDSRDHRNTVFMTTRNHNISFRISMRDKELRGFQTSKRYKMTENFAPIYIQLPKMHLN
jgi:hypothetical protein